MENTILWCLAIRPESDSPHEQSPAESKELAERALERYKAITLSEGNQIIIENFEDLVQVQQWEGTPEQHKENMLINEAWFNLAFFACQNIEQAETVFKYGDIVHCYNGEKELITKDFAAAKKFYGVEDLEPPKYCDQCYDGNSDTVFPYFGRAPHGDDRTLPANFTPGVEDAACGVYTHCLNCGAGDGEPSKTAQPDQEIDAFEKAWKENRHTWESTKNLAKSMFYAGQSSAVPEWGVVVPILSARYLFNTVHELGFKNQEEKDTVLYHLNYMASGFVESAKKFVEDDHAKQKSMIETGEQGHE